MKRALLALLFLAPALAFAQVNLTSPPAFRNLTGSPTDNSALNTALNGKLGTAGNGSSLTGLSASQITPSGFPSQIVVSGAGTSAANGTYTYNALANGGVGGGYYGPNNYSITYVGIVNQWILSPPPGGGSQLYGGTSTTFPWQATWSTLIGGGVTPVPTVTELPATAQTLFSQFLNGGGQVTIGGFLGNTVMAGGLISSGAVSGTSWTGTGKIQTTLTAEQMRLGYDSSNYMTVTTSSAGTATFGGAGIANSFVFAPGGNTGLTIPAGATPGISVAGEAFVTKTSEQMRVRYDTGNYVATSVGFNGITTFTASGIAASFIFVTGAVTAATLQTSSLTLPGTVIFSSTSGQVRMKEGVNGKADVATLTAGTVTVPNIFIASTTRVKLFAQDNNVTGALRCSARVAGTSFTITSSNSADSGVVYWELMDPAP